MLVFFFGCARSGTSVLGELIAQHPNVDYLGEQNQALWHGLNDDDHHRMTSYDATDEAIATLREAYQHEGRVLVEKMPTHSLRIPFIRRVFPEAKLIYIIRDGRDVACSLMPGVGGDSWNHLKPPAWRSMMQVFTGLERCARLWQVVTEIVEADLTEAGANGQPIRVDHLRIRYEDLVAAPLIMSDVICEYLGLEPDAAMLDYCEKIQDKNTGHIAEPGKAWHRDDHSQRVRRWLENCSIAEWEMLERVLGPTLKELGYSVLSDG